MRSCVDRFFGTSRTPGQAVAGYREMDGLVGDLVSYRRDRPRRPA
ncbi:hypothetical protein NONI108955_09225 [Nocardia ninae]|nr:cytochrome P450 [Nocardia ninae]